MAFQKGDASMRKLLFRDKFFLFICLAPTLTYAAAQQGYFVVSRNYTWTAARNYCQVCYKELVTLTPENSQLIARKIKSEHWIGLRKRFSNSTDNNQTLYDSTTSTYSSTYGYDDGSYSDNSTNSSNSSTSTSMEWTQWANGDPLSFQNWYPGWPAPKFPLPKIDCCSCSCTCPAPPTATVAPTNNPLTTTPSPGSSRTSNSPATLTRTEMTGFHSLANVTDRNGTSSTDATDMTSFTDATDVTDMSSSTDSKNRSTSQGSWGSTTNTATSSTNTATASAAASYITTSHTTGTSYWTSKLPIESTCEQSPMEPPVIPEPYKNYIEDSCVAMLGFGPWIEKHCFEYLPFICYEDVFIGEVNVTNITSSNASLSWLQAPGDPHLVEYTVNITGDNQWVYNTTNLTLDLFGLTAGTNYSVHVFPVKCQRTLNPEKTSFYTTPLKVGNLTVIEVMETSVTLGWAKPVGNKDFYIISTKDYGDKKSPTESFKYDGLTAGTCFKFSVLSVNNDSKRSEESDVTTCTMPSKVTNLKVNHPEDTKLTLTWSPPAGNYTGFRVRAYIGNESRFDSTMNTTTMTVTNLTSGSEVIVYVAVVANYSLEGENVTVTSYTTPDPIANLSLVATHNTINAYWNYTKDMNFTVTLQGDPADNKTTTAFNYEFKKLKTAANYTVFVSAVSGTLTSPPVKATIFTFASPPSNPRVNSTNTSSITFQWDAPENAGNNINYIVNVSSNFWKYTDGATVIDVTSYTFSNLTSGSTYNLSVYIKSPNNQSLPVTCSGQTVSVEMTIGLSMLCSSAQSLFCDAAGTRKDVFQQLSTYFEAQLQNASAWSLSGRDP